MKAIKIYLVPVAVIGALLLLYVWDFGPGPCLAAQAAKSKCDEIGKRFDDVLSGATYACRTDEDCGCFGPATMKSPCGGLADRKTADRLRVIAQEFRGAGCDVKVRCRPWYCKPFCDKGICMNKRQI